MNFSGRPGLSSLGIGIAAYVIGAVFAAAVTTHAALRVGAAVLEQLAPAADAVSVTPLQSVHRQAAMTPLADRWDGRWAGVPVRPRPRVWGAATQQFGASSRNPYRSFGAAPLDSDDDDDARVVGTFRTL